MMTRQEASKIIEQYRMCSSGDCPTLECADCEYNHDPRKVEEAFLMAIDALESAQPERKTGHWIDKTDPEWDGEWGDWKCSCCGVVLSSMAINLNGTYLYCPKCGAEMRGEQDETYRCGCANRRP